MTFGNMPLNCPSPVGSGRLLNSSASSETLDMYFSRGMLGLTTVVQQRLYSWMILGYRELKSSKRVIFSQSPGCGSSTRPPKYLDFFFFGGSSVYWLGYLSGQMYLCWQNSCMRSTSFLSARWFYKDLIHRLPAMFVSCFVKGSISKQNMRSMEMEAAQELFCMRASRD